MSLLDFDFEDLIGGGGALGVSAKDQQRGNALDPNPARTTQILPGQGRTIAAPYDERQNSNGGLPALSEKELMIEGEQSAGHLQALQQAHSAIMRGQDAEAQQFFDKVLGSSKDPKMISLAWRLKQMQNLASELGQYPSGKAPADTRPPVAQWGVDENGDPLPAPPASALASARDMTRTHANADGVIIDAATQQPIMLTGAASPANDSGDRSNVPAGQIVFANGVASEEGGDNEAPPPARPGMKVITVGPPTGKYTAQLKPGAVMNGYSYLGGDPNNPANWKSR